MYLKTFALLVYTVAVMLTILTLATKAAAAISLTGWNAL